LIHESLRIATTFLINKTKSNGNQLLIRHKENEEAYVKECFKLLREFSSKMDFDEVCILNYFSNSLNFKQFCQDLYGVCMFYYQETQNRDIIKLVVKCLADCVSFCGPNSKVCFCFDLFDFF
jgi:hypothetical protein